MGQEDRIPVWKNVGFEAMKGLQNGTPEYTKQYNKCYYALNKDRIKKVQYEKKICDTCGVRYTRVNESHHRSSKRHQRAQATFKTLLEGLTPETLTPTRVQELADKVREISRS